MNDESIYAQPFDEKFVKALTSPNVKDWYRYRLGVESPSLGEILDMPGARTGRFDRADQERITLFKLYKEHQMKAFEEQRGRDIMPPSFEAAQQQNPLAFATSGIQPPPDPITRQNVFELGGVNAPPGQERAALMKAMLPGRGEATQRTGQIQPSLTDIIPRGPVVTSEYQVPNIQAPLSPSQQFAYRQALEKVPGLMASQIGPPKITAHSVAQGGKLVLTDEQGNVVREVEGQEKDDFSKVRRGLKLLNIPEESPEGQRHIKAALETLETHPPAPQQTVVMAQEKSFESELGKKQAEMITKSRENADDAVSMINTVHEGRKLLDSPMITGFGADFIVSANQALRQMGFQVGGEKIENTQAFAAAMASNVGRVIKQFGSGTGLSDADREYAEKMAAGRITMERGSLLKILDINERQARWVIKKHNQRSKGIKTNIPLAVEEPPPFNNLPTVRTDADFNALPPGTEFMAPDGTRRRKP